MPGPGVIVTTSARPGSSTSAVPESARAFLAARFERGSTTEPIRVRSAGELESMCGPAQNYGAGWDCVLNAFREGAGEVYVARVVGPGAVAATISLLDRAATPLATIAVTALSKGAWATGWKVKVEAGNVAGVTISIIDTASVVREVFPNRATVAEIGAIKSGFFALTNLANATAAPTNLPATGTFTLAGGTDDAAAITMQHYVDAYARFSSALKGGVVALPGFAPSTVVGSTTVTGALGAHGRDFSRNVIVGAAPGTTYSAARAEFAALRASGLEHVQYVWPALITPEGKTLDPTYLGIGARARAHSQYHPGHSPAHTGHSLSGARPEFEVSDDIASALNDDGISVVRTIAGRTQLYGARSMSPSPDYRLVTVKDMENSLIHDLRETVQPFVHDDIDSDKRFASKLKGVITGRLMAIKRRGGLYDVTDERGRVVGPAFVVDADSLNTPQSLAANIFKVLLSWRPSPKAELIQIELVYTPLNAA